MKKLFAYSCALSVLCALVLLSGNCKKHHSEELPVIIPTVNPIQHSVLVYLITPNDKTFNAQYYKGVKSSILSMQSWYKTQMGTKTFVLNPVVVDTATGLHQSSWYNSNNGPAISGSGTKYAYSNMLYELHQMLGAKFDTSAYTYFAYVVADVPDETIPKGVALEGLANITGIAGSSPNKWIGAGGHALGHAFGLPEVSITNPQAIMSTGFPLYPNCILQQAEKDSLNASPFFIVQ